MIGRAEIMDGAHAGAIGGTYIGNPVAGAALAVLDVIEDEGLVARAVVVGDRIREQMHAWQGRWPAIGDVRGLGAMLALELVRDPLEGAGAGARGRGDRRGAGARRHPPQGGCPRELHPRAVPAHDRGAGARRGARGLGGRAGRVLSSPQARIRRSPLRRRSAVHIPCAASARTASAIGRSELQRPAPLVALEGELDEPVEQLGVGHARRVEELA